MRFLLHVATIVDTGLGTLLEEKTTMAASIENILARLGALLLEVQRLASAVLDAGFELLGLLLGT